MKQSIMPVPGGFTKLSQLTDVNFSTAPTDGQVMVWDALATFTATNSPLRWNGNDYKQPNLGATHTPSLVYIFSSTGREIYADGQTFYNESQAQNLHIGLVTWTDTTKTTLIVPNNFLTSQGQAETGAGLQALLRAAVDATCTVDNFKASAFTYNSGASYTWNGFTGFSQAGAVTVVSGQTTPPAITYVAPPRKMKPLSGVVPHHYACGIFAARNDTAQAVANNTATVIALDTNAIVTDPYFSNSDSTNHTVALGAYTITGGRGVITLKDNSNALIPTAVIEFQKQNQDTSWTTQYTGLGGSLTFPFEYGDGQNSVTFRVRVTQTSGSSKSVYCELHFYWDV